MSSDNIDYFKQGQHDCRTYYSGQAKSSLTKNVKPEDAMKLYWPPETEMLIQIETPLPKPRQKWLAGFKKEQVIIFAEMKIQCLYCGNALNGKEHKHED